MRRPWDRHWRFVKDEEDAGLERLSRGELVALVQEWQALYHDRHGQLYRLARIAGVEKAPWWRGSLELWVLEMAKRPRPPWWRRFWREVEDGSGT